jgi:hypothetical protein
VRDRTLIYLDDELPAAFKWAQRHATPILWIKEELELRVTLNQPQTDQLFYLRGQFDVYRELSPAWTFSNSTWITAGSRTFFPAPIASPYGASIFHTNGVICAPFNRLAYSKYSGPHSDWGGPESWLTAGRPNEVKAHCVADMLAVIDQHFRYTQGRMA